MVEKEIGGYIRIQIPDDNNLSGDLFPLMIYNKSGNRKSISVFDKSKIRTKLYCIPKAPLTTQDKTIKEVLKEVTGQEFNQVILINFHLSPYYRLLVELGQGWMDTKKPETKKEKDIFCSTFNSARIKNFIQNGYEVGECEFTWLFNVGQHLNDIATSVKTNNHIKLLLHLGHYKYGVEGQYIFFCSENVPIVDPPQIQKQLTVICQQIKHIQALQKSCLKFVNSELMYHVRAGETIDQEPLFYIPEEEWFLLKGEKELSKEYIENYNIENSKRNALVLFEYDNVVIGRGFFISPTQIITCFHIVFTIGKEKCAFKENLTLLYIKEDDFETGKISKAVIKIDNVVLPYAAKNQNTNIGYDLCILEPNLGKRRKNFFKLFPSWKEGKIDKSEIPYILNPKQSKSHQYVLMIRPVITNDLLRAAMQISDIIGSFTIKVAYHCNTLEGDCGTPVLSQTGSILCMHTSRGHEAGPSLGQQFNFGTCIASLIKAESIVSEHKALFKSIAKEYFVGNLDDFELYWNELSKLYKLPNDVDYERLLEQDQSEMILVGGDYTLTHCVRVLFSKFLFKQHIPSIFDSHVNIGSLTLQTLISRAIDNFPPELLHNFAFNERDQTEETYFLIQFPNLKKTEKKEKKINRKRQHDEISLESSSLSNSQSGSDSDSNSNSESESDLDSDSDSNEPHSNIDTTSTNEKIDTKNIQFCCVKEKESFVMFLKRGAKITKYSKEKGMEPSSSSDIKELYYKASIVVTKKNARKM